MKSESRAILAFAVFLYALWAEATYTRHFAGTPDRGLHWLFVAPALACLLTAIGLALEHLQARSGAIALTLQVLGLALLTWRSLWMFFSWDGMLLFPAWCGLATAVIVRQHPRWLPEA